MWGKSERGGIYSRKFLYPSGGKTRRGVVLGTTDEKAILERRKKGKGKKR